MVDDVVEDRQSIPGQPGMAIDASGGQAYDPSKNVADLVKAKGESDDALRKENQRFFDAQLGSADKFHNFAREATEKYQNFAREAGDKYNTAIVNAETRRIDQLAQTRQEFQNTIRDMLAESVRTTSTLVSTQLVQIQATFDTRVSKLEAQAFTAAGRSSVADPAMESAMARMSSGIISLSTQTSETLAKMQAMNAEGMAKLTGTMTTMQANAAMTAGETAGSGEATAAQVRAAGMAMLREQSGHSSTQILVSAAVGVVAALSLVLSIFVAMRQPPAAPTPVYQVPGPVYQAPPSQYAPSAPAPQRYHSRGTGYHATLV